jgi:hypothetical protein
MTPATRPEPAVENDLLVVTDPEGRRTELARF